MLPSKGNNMANINQMKRKSLGIIRIIFAKLQSMHLNQYYFECAIILINAILRSSIFYASETYYDLKEKEIRQLERIEECFLRKLLKTGRNCPIVQLYLEVGQIPGRFEMMKMRLLFLKHILDQNQESRIFKIFEAQKLFPTKGDWVSMCKRNIEDINLELSMNEIKAMTKTKFTTILKKKISNAAFEYLLKKQGKKGGEIKYSGVQMASYLQPYCSVLTINEKQEIFSIRNGMVNIPANYGTKSECICGKNENLAHIYECQQLNREQPKLEFEQIYSENIKKYEVYTKDSRKI